MNINFISFEGLQICDSNSTIVFWQKNINFIPFLGLENFVGLISEIKPKEKQMKIAAKVQHLRWLKAYTTASTSPLPTSSDFHHDFNTPGLPTSNHSLVGLVVKASTLTRVEDPGFESRL